MVARFALATEIAAPVGRVFDLCLDVEAHLRSMARSRERAIAGRTDGILELDDQVTWRARHFGIPWKMTVRITELDRPRRFVDQQVTGPFESFRHQHDFEPTREGTRMTDTIEFVAPFGLIGRLAESLVLERRLRTLIEVRNRYLQQAAAG
ncbi:MAG: SRPBCC family protein [Nitriliruptoraceae bacterium]